MLYISGVASFGLAYLRVYNLAHYSQELLLAFWSVSWRYTPGESKTKSSRLAVENMALDVTDLQNFLQVGKHCKWSFIVYATSVRYIICHKWLDIGAECFPGTDD